MSAAFGSFFSSTFLPLGEIQPSQIYLSHHTPGGSVWSEILFPIAPTGDIQRVGVTRWCGWGGAPEATPQGLLQTPLSLGAQ